jgi:hypothetical protein
MGFEVATEHCPDEGLPLGKTEPAVMRWPGWSVTYPGVAGVLTVVSVKQGIA